ncbi:hypothetical protein C4D60_Mb02t00060 [Musa balbisiana]|uniref:Repressor of RNA polymerase III transcription n=1 Tax=Musa balbisiana TaxID=52838 RepID=A0A4S8I758_MUSBA|nr:hypothetical protein C4D60_Mb02t00060 [Musa balbisiana]
MKFLEYTPLDSINLFLDHLNLGESTIIGNLEAFSCKQTGTDRKLSFSLEQEILDYLEQSSDSDSHLPVEYLTSRSSRKTLIYLVLTLSHMYPDYDFSSAVRSHLCFREEEWDNFKQIYDMYLFEAARVCSCPCISFINWRWAFNFFFYNRKLKRVVSFRCCCFSKLAAEDFLGNDVLREEEEEEDLLDDMEM